MAWGKNFTKIFTYRRVCPPMSRRYRHRLCTNWLKRWKNHVLNFEVILEIYDKNYPRKKDSCLYDTFEIRDLTCWVPKKKK